MFKKHDTIESLSYKIKHDIKNRIYVSLLMVSFIPIFAVLYSIYASVESTKNQLYSECSILGDYVIGQYLVDNTQAISSKILSFNATHTYNVQWINGHGNQGYETHKQKHFSIRWNEFRVVYPLKPKVDLGEIDLGYFAINGKISIMELINKNNIPIEVVIFTFLFSILLYYLLVPLAIKIPHQLILEPINHLFTVIEQNGVIPENTKPGNYYELQIIQERILHLISLIEENSKEAAIGKMASEIAHNINSPLQVLFGLIQEESFKQRLAPDGYNILLKQIKEIKDSISEILAQRNTITRQINERPKISYCNMLGLIESVIYQKHLEWEQLFNIELKLNIDSIIWIETFEHQFRNMISNLLNNAYEAITDVNKHIQVTVDNIGEAIILQIVDNGLGIPASEIHNVINGKSLKSSGNGIGLSSANTYINSMGGTLTLQSEENVGTKINIKLPKFTVPEWCASKFILPRNRQIVILDNDKATILFWQNHLLLNPISPKFFVNSSDFINWYKQNASDIVVIADYVIDTINSKDNIELLKSLGIKTAYIITQYANESGLQFKIKDSGFMIFAKWVIWPSTYNKTHFQLKRNHLF